MKKAIVSFGFDRPEMMEASFKSIMQCPEYLEYNWHCYLDGQGRAQKSFYQEDYREIRFIIRDQGIGLNANILLAFKELFEFYKYDYILYVEDDVIVSDDFIGRPRIISATGSTRTVGYPNYGCVESH